MNNRIAINQKRNKNFENWKSMRKQIRQLKDTSFVELKTEKVSWQFLFKVLFHELLFFFSISLMTDSFSQLSLDLPVDMFLILAAISLSGFLGLAYFGISLVRDMIL